MEKHEEFTEEIWQELFEALLHLWEWADGQTHEFATEATEEGYSEAERALLKEGYTEEEIGQRAMAYLYAIGGPDMLIGMDRVGFDWSFMDI